MMTCFLTLPFTCVTLVNCYIVYFRYVESYDFLFTQFDHHFYYLLYFYIFSVVVMKIYPSANLISVLMFSYSRWKTKLWQLFASSTYSCHPGVLRTQARISETQEFGSTKSDNSFKSHWTGLGCFNKWHIATPAAATAREEGTYRGGNSFSPYHNSR